MGLKALLFSRDPGGANAIIPLVKPLIKKGFQVYLYGKDFALSKYQEARLEYYNLSDSVNNVNLENINHFIKTINPGLVITATADDFTERYIWKICQNNHIPAFAVCDQWLNYGVRFSDYTSSEIENYNKNRTHPYLPSGIFIMDEYAKNEMVMDGIPKDIIIISGHPYFETLLQFKSSFPERDISHVKEKLNISADDFIVTFASEPISVQYNESDDTPHYWGYTERTIFKEFLDSLCIMAKKSKKKISLLIKPHPKEPKDNFRDIINNFKTERINIRYASDIHSWHVIMASDVICGMSSLFLLESIILQKPVLSITIGLKRENPFILDRRNILKSILYKDALNQKLSEVILENKYDNSHFGIIHNPIENILNYLYQYLCQN